MKIEKGVKLDALPGAANLVDGKPTIFLLLRFFGCRITKVILWNICEQYQQIQQAGGQIVAVVQSCQEVLDRELKQWRIPFPLISDPEQIWYKMFDVSLAENQEQMLKGSAAIITEAERLGLEKGEAEGNPLQLPATMLVDGNRIVQYIRYGECGMDVPDPEDMIGLLQKL